MQRTQAARTNSSCLDRSNNKIAQTYNKLQIFQKQLKIAEKINGHCLQCLKHFEIFWNIAQGAYLEITALNMIVAL